MKQFLCLALLSFLFARLSPAAATFGNAPDDQAAKDLTAKIVGAHRSGSVADAIAILDRDGRAFIKQSAATGRFDFFSSLMAEANGGKGRENRDWSLALTEWCYRYCRDVGEDYWLDKFTPEMHRCYFQAGKYGAAREVLEYDRLRQLENQEDLDILSFASGGPVNPSFPAIAKRTPGKMKNLQTKKFAIFIALAQQDLAEGKWRRAMEAAALGYSNAMGMYLWHKERAHLTDSKSMMTGTTGHWRRLRTVMAAGYRFLDLKELELQECLELISFNEDEGRNYWDVQLADARAMHLKVILGLADSSVLKDMEATRLILLKPSYNAPDDADLVHLMMADIHFRTGQEASGWEIIDKLRTTKNLSRDMRYEIDMEWCRHRVATGKYDTVENQLVALLAIAREGGLKQREIALYEIYADLLIGLGRHGDALLIQKELLRLLESFDLFTRIPTALGKLARIQALMGQSAQAETSLKQAQERLAAAAIPSDAKARLRTRLDIPLPSPAQGVETPSAVTDLQPIRSMSIPLAGLPARGLFTLTNLSNKESRGELGLRGTGLVFQEGADDMIAVDTDAPNGKPTLSRVLSLPPGSVTLIDFSRWEEAGNRETRVMVEWKPSTGKPQTAEWRAEQEEKAVSIAITDAAEYTDNPFYLIPIYHLLQYKDTFAQAADLRVVASQPARVELYNATEELVFVDANGDGAFVSEGDLVSADLNRNGYGDIELKPDAKESRFRLFVRPLKQETGKEITFDVQLFNAGKWETFSSDRLLFPKADNEPVHPPKPVPAR